jgi:hypothetical protein
MPEVTYFIVTEPLGLAANPAEGIPLGHNQSSTRWLKKEYTITVHMLRQKGVKVCRF